jgi:benzodiazapine receptor
MTDRSDNDQQSGDDLDYLDATFPDHGEPTETVPPPARPLPGERVAATAAIPPPAVAPPAATSSAPTTDDRTWFWPIANLCGLIVVVAVNYLANWMELNGQSTGDVVNQDPVPFQPAGWVFAIWGVIYLLLAAFAFYGLTPGGRHNARLQRVSPVFLVANIANVTWIVLWHYEQFFAALVTIVVLLVSLLVIYIGLRIRNPIRRSVPAERPTLAQRLVFWLPFSVYLGWVIVATLANLMVWLERSGWDGGPFSYNVWAVIFMTGGTVVSSIFAWLARDPIIPLVMMVAFVGIANHAWGDSTLVASFGIIFAVVQAALAAMAWVMSSEDARPAPDFGQNTTATM